MENLSSVPVFLSTSSKDPPKLDNLPDLVYSHILKNLYLDELWSLKLINKKFNAIVKDFKIIHLSFLDLNPYSYDINLDCWFSTNKPTRSEYQLDISKLSLLFKLSNNFLNLKYLRVGNLDDPFKLDDLNIFTNLQILETSWSYKSFENHLLKLPSLKALSIERAFYETLPGSLVIDAPNLHSLSTRYASGIKFSYPQSVKFYRTDLFDTNMTVLINLECLEFRYSFPKNFKTDDLFKFKNLKRLRFVDCSSNHVSDFEDLFRSKKDDLDLVLFGVKIKEINKIDEYNNLSRLKFQLYNYGDLEDGLEFVKFIRYDDLVPLLPSNQPSDLLDKYKNIQYINIYSRIEDVDLLIRFVRGCFNLYLLNLINSFLGQQFYDELPVINSLSTLRISNIENLNLDYEFIMKMPSLRSFNTNEDVLISEQLNLNYFKRLYFFSFRVNNQDFDIVKRGKNRYKACSHKSLGLLDHDKLVELTDLLRRKIETRSMARKRKLFN